VSAAGTSYAPSLQPPTNTGNNNRRGGGQGSQPRPTKTLDKTKEQRKAEHNERWETAAAKRRAEGAAREAARQAALNTGQEPTYTGTTPPTATIPPGTLPNLPLTPPTQPYTLPSHTIAEPTIDPNLAIPPGDEEKDIFLDPIQGDEGENPDEELDLDSQNDSNHSKTISGVKELRVNQPEDEVNSAKKARQETPPNE
jgi:hypothetical protein